MMTTYGREAGKPHYVYVGSQLMIDPTFYDHKTKSALKMGVRDIKQKLHYKEFYVD